MPYIRPPSYYQSLFQYTVLPYLVSDILNVNYGHLKCLFIYYADKGWTNFLPKSVIKQTLKDGIDFFGNNKLFIRYKSGFENYKNESEKFFFAILKKSQFTKSDAENFWKFVIRLHNYYIKTEFFYTDAAFLESKNNLVIKNNLAEFEMIKNSGREYLNKIFFGDLGYINQFLKIISRQFQVPLDDLWQYGHKETMQLFVGQRVDKKTILNRRQGYMIAGVDKKSFILIGREVKPIANKFLKKKKNSNILKGTIANKGKVVGRVKVFVAGFYKYDELSKVIDSMKPGEILVADTTSPELIVACHKAGAIITNQGGLMSHAAIVSRELNIPCIVGTGNATQILQDGFLIEVDAGKGEVKILKK